MAAQMMETTTELKLEGFGHELLENWAPWARDDSEGHHSWNMKTSTGRGYWGDPPDEYWIVDKIVAPHRRDKSNYWLCVSRYYLGERALWEITKELGYHWPEKRVLLNLVAFGALVEREYRDYLDAHPEIRLKSAC